MKIRYKFITPTKPVKFEIPRPQGFVVKELISKNAMKKYRDDYKYAIFLMKKTNLNTRDAIRMLAKSIGIKERDIGFSGLKDKNAITYQYISVRKEFKDMIKNLPNVEFFFISFGRKLKPGDLLGNEFEVLLYPMPNKDFISEFSKFHLFPNYFGVQRFGVERHNHIIGYHILRGEYEKAYYLSNHKISDKYEIKFYVNAYQSWIFNEILSTAIENGIRSGSAPLPGFNSKPKKNWIWSEINRIHKDHGISLNNYRINKHEITIYGAQRSLFINVKNISFTDKLRFVLPRGSYATVILNEMLKVSEP